MSAETPHPRTVFEYLGEGRFTILENPPSWFAQLWGSEISGQEKLVLSEKSPFLESFLSEAESFWNAQRPFPAVMDELYRAVAARARALALGEEVE